MGTPCEICGTEPAALLTLLEGSESLPVAVLCPRHRNAIVFEIGQAVGQLLRSAKTQGAAPSARAETGAMQFGSDWRGLFLRGDDALYFGTQLGLLGNWLQKQPVYPTNGMHILDALSDLLLRVNQQRRDVEAQLLRPFSECSGSAALGPAGYPKGEE